MGEGYEKFVQDLRSYSFFRLSSFLRSSSFLCHCSAKVKNQSFSLLSQAKNLIVALLSQTKKSECGMAQLSSCIAGLNVMNKWYVRKEGSATN